jgi:hypothetical protein
LAKVLFYVVFYLIYFPLQVDLFFIFPFFTSFSHTPPHPYLSSPTSSFSVLICYEPGFLPVSGTDRPGLLEMVGNTKAGKPHHSQRKWGKMDIVCIAHLPQGMNAVADFLKKARGTRKKCNFVRNLMAVWGIWARLVCV